MDRRSSKENGLVGKDGFDRTVFAETLARPQRRGANPKYESRKAESRNPSFSARTRRAIRPIVNKMMAKSRSKFF
jgi:hypothetical protein